ncbi:hypothetical protein PBY51_020948 [Eleginops maclovinus]|uniref:Uncharacterized protein n=1 Tax=Eleginops maclovinus TaxID=56733 RepID=A0AAN7XGY0_ELEMC|nr:hypothetical protein PBY51_020948 [Eleginops maclovinus]
MEEEEGISTMEIISKNRSHSETQTTSSGNSSEAETRLQTFLVQIRLVRIHFLAVVGGTTTASDIAAGQAARFSGALLVSLPSVLASHLLTQASVLSAL